MNIFNVTTKIGMALMLFCAAAQAMKPAATAKKLAPHDKFITQVRINSTTMPDIQRIYFMPYSAGPRMGVQEVPGITLNGIQDYASRLMQKGTWKIGQSLVYKLEKPVLINVTTHNPELAVGIEKLDGQGKTSTFMEKEINRFGESNELRITIAKELIVGIEPL